MGEEVSRIELAGRLMAAGAALIPQKPFFCIATFFCLVFQGVWAVFIAFVLFSKLVSITPHGVRLAVPALFALLVILYGYIGSGFYSQNQKLPLRDAEAAEESPCDKDNCLAPRDVYGRGV